MASSRTIRCLLVLLAFPAALSAQSHQDSLDLWQAFLDLHNPAVAMDLSAHPDDEDGSTLAYLRMKHGVHTYSVLFTRGEGGQNEKGAELYEELGVLRSRETEDAGKILGAEVRFLNFMDFGYSKTASEAFRKWGGSREVLRRLVYVVRKYKPDILFTNHNTIDGHGHHQAVAITALAAFDAAADSTCFPEQLREPGLTVWQVRKLFFRVGGRAEPTADVFNPILETDPLRGIAYVDIASRALQQHRTQGMEHANLRSWARTRTLYKLMRSNSLYEADSTSFFSGIDYWRDPSLAPLQSLHAGLMQWHFGAARDSLLRAASSALRQLDSLRRSPARSVLFRRMTEEWRSEIERIVSLTCGIQASLAFRDSIVVAGQSVECRLQLASVGCSMSDVRVRFALPRGWRVDEQHVRASPPAVPTDGRNFVLRVGSDLLPTLPGKVAQYNSLERHQDVIAHVEYQVDGLPLSMRLSPAFEVAPPQWLIVEPEVAGYIPGRSGGSLAFSWSLTNSLPRRVNGTIAVQLPPGWRSSPVRFDIKAEDDTAAGMITVHPPRSVEPGEYVLTFNAAQASASVPVSVFDVTVAKNLRLGIITSYDNTLEAASKELDVPFELVTDAELEGGELGRFTSIIVDIRAYMVRDALKKFNDRLLDYVRNGGNLIVMYQREREWKPEYAPYPFQVTRRRVTVEEAPVTMLAPDHPLLAAPNRITERDWAGWKQERGVYFPGDVPKEYTRLLSTSDPDEEPLTTGYLLAHVGKGSYMYTSFVWYRQLKEENPGAFRCLANMISYSSTRK